MPWKQFIELWNLILMFQKWEILWWKYYFSWSLSNSWKYVDQSLGLHNLSQNCFSLLYFDTHYKGNVKRDLERWIGAVVHSKLCNCVRIKFEMCSPSSSFYFSYREEIKWHGLNKKSFIFQIIKSNFLLP